MANEINGLRVSTYTHQPTCNSNPIASYLGSYVDQFTVTNGQLTFDSEGVEDSHSRYFSRVAHVPSNASGVTIGRGYDMKLRTGSEIKADLMVAGVDETTANLYSRGAGLSGNRARRFVEATSLPEISPAQQKILFEMVYDELAQDVKRICTKKDTVAAYGSVDWDNLDSRIKEVVIDLRYRGDYSPATRRVIQKSIANNDFGSFKELLSDRSLWSTVPKDRFERRVNYLNAK